MTIFQPRSITIKAVQVNIMNMDPVNNFLEPHCHISLEAYPKEEGTTETTLDMFLHTLGGISPAFENGTWIIKDKDGYFYPCPDSVFTATYQPVM